MRSMPFLVAAMLAAAAGNVHAEEEEAPKDKEPLSFAGRVFTRAHMHDPRQRRGVSGRL